MTQKPLPTDYIRNQVSQALAEDIGPQDLTADLIPATAQAHARLITRETMTLAGQHWANEVFAQLDSNIQLQWHAQDGEQVAANQTLCYISGPARTILSGERTAINFLQTLSATATLTARYVAAVKGIAVDILDTRKTLPGWRLAQKYAVRCGGGVNHRFGLYDAILIKENHINAAGSIAAAVAQARQQHPTIAIEVEVETLEELRQSLAAHADIILLDNFSLQQLQQAVEITQRQALLEASGGVNLDSIYAIAQTGVDRISVGALTKDIQAIDLSLRFE